MRGSQEALARLACCIERYSYQLRVKLGTFRKGSETNVNELTPPEQKPRLPFLIRMVVVLIAQYRSPLRAGPLGLK